MNQFIYIR